MATLPPGGLVLITGANGYIAGVTVQKLLDLGYSVRGTVRSVEKHKWMLSHYGPNFSLIEVPEMSADNAFDKAVEGVDGIAHIASMVEFNPDPHAIIPGAIKSAVTILEAAAKEPKVKSVVYTSSQAACVMLEPGKPYAITPGSWNDASLKLAWEPSEEQTFGRGIINYMAAKTGAEQASFKWVDEHKPHFTFNSVVPNCNFGTVIAPTHTGFPTSAGLVKLLFYGNTMGAGLIPPEWYVDVEDSALLHVAALTQPDVKNERIFAFGERFTWNQILGLFRKFCPDRTFLKDIEEPPADRGTVTNERAAELLKRLGKPNGFSTLEEGIQKAVKSIVAVEGLELPKSELEKQAEQMVLQAK
ncbi:NAD(P)-binding protein [Zopfia rhizophila CBS 207.26]|uniref:NAD(P)-binding protein n=1 Tax=Zopfia rhizophila CBS 207.26 TaxID=1314779 RepID=A0A6A6E414_9PEZI|nr:NAD(P)-binding protein [Zopfia rhizophila CBS 207.26]